MHQSELEQRLGILFPRADIFSDTVGMMDPKLAYTHACNSFQNRCSFTKVLVQTVVAIFEQLRKRQRVCGTFPLQDERGRLAEDGRGPRLPGQS